MMMTVFVLRAVSAFVIAMVHAMGKAPLWPAVLLLAVAEVRRALPLGREEGVAVSTAAGTGTVGREGARRMSTRYQSTRLTPPPVSPRRAERPAAGDRPPY